MNGYDLTPLLRTTVGFDRMARIMDAAMAAERPTRSYPPYNIARRDEDHYRITLAVAGFGESDLHVQTLNGRLVVTGRVEGDEEGVQYLHRGIAGRSFEHVFQLADHLRVTGARLDNGLLHIELERELPEALKPRTIAIASGAATQIEAAAAK
jgi:molecular chaperone IbpA